MTPRRLAWVLIALAAVSLAAANHIRSVGLLAAAVYILALVGILALCHAAGSAD